jgi:hypothetical protein
MTRQPRCTYQGKYTSLALWDSTLAGAARIIDYDDWEDIDMKTRQIAAAALASILSASPAWPAHALDEHDSYRPFGAGPLTCGNFARALDGLDPRDKDSPKVTFTNYKRFVNGWLTAADRFIPGLNDATGGRDADWFTGVLVSHCRANPSLTIADALEQIINIRFPRLFAEKAPPVTYRSTATNNVLDKPPADETRAATDCAEAASRAEKAAAAVAPPKLSMLSDNPPTTPTSLGLDDIARIHSTYKANQARFVRDFVGKTFSARMPLGDIKERKFHVQRVISCIFWRQYVGWRS